MIFLTACATQWTDSQYPHCSAIMLPDGRIFGRVILKDGSFRRLDSVLVPGDDIQFWPESLPRELPGFVQRHAQLFGSGTTQRLRHLSVAVVGCSGTGSPVIEQLARLGVGRIVLVDPDKVEEKNLNRIINATRDDADHQRPKVDLLARAIEAMGLATEVLPLAENLISRRAVEAVAECDVVFGCMDGVEGRHLLNRLAAYYLLPYFDLGVKLQADGHGGIDEACGAIHYVRPDGESLLDRRVYTTAQLKADGLRRTDPVAYREQIRVGYIHGVQEDRPAVISINTQIASYAVNELLARLHPYRLAMQGKCMPNTAQGELVSAFISPLLEQPEGLRRWKVFVTDTDPPRTPGKLGRTYVFGWDGRKFLGTRDYE